MPTTIYDSSLITQRQRDKAISGSFINRIQNASDPRTGSAPMLGITEQSIINTVKNGQMTDFRKNEGGCTTISPGCPCNLPVTVPVGIVTNINYSYGSIIATWDPPLTGTAPFQYNVKLIPTTLFQPGLNFKVYNGYFGGNAGGPPGTNDNVNYFNSITPLSGKNGYTSNFSSLTFSTNNLSVPADYFSVQWTGYFLPSSTGSYRFRTTSDDASYVWVGNNAQSGFTMANATVNNGGVHGGTTVTSAPVNLIGGVYYPIRIMYGERTGGATFTFSFDINASGTFINNGAYFFSPTETLSVITNTTSYTFPTSQLAPPGVQYNLSVGAINSISVGASEFYGGVTPSTIDALYLPPTMAVSGATDDTCTISYNFPTATYGTGFTVTGANFIPSLPSGWAIQSINNTTLVLEKTGVNPASLLPTQIELTGAGLSDITYPSNVVTGISTLGITPSLAIDTPNSTGTTCVLTYTYPNEISNGFTVTGAQADPTTPLPSNWSITSANNTTMILTWNETGTPLIGTGIKFILTGANGVASPSSNSISNINVISVTLTGYSIGGGTNPGNADINGLLAMTYPKTLYEGVMTYYPDPVSGPYGLILQSNGTIQVIDGSPAVTYTYQAGPPAIYLCTADVYNGVGGRSIIGEAYFST